MQGERVMSEEEQPDLIGGLTSGVFVGWLAWHH
jgi:hypothetical protein